MSSLSLLFGSLIGLSLGLTGGGGAIFAVPLLVYGLDVAPREAVGISLASVGATALLGFLGRWRLGQVELRTGLLFAAAGMVGAPAGSWLGGHVPESLLLLLFAGLMLIVAARMWRQAGRGSSPPSDMTAAPASAMPNPTADSATCERDASGQLRYSSRCGLMLLVVGLAAGVLSGLFGVGGGFIIVPALVLVSGMPIHRAVGTSLLVVALVSAAGLGSHLWAGRSIAPLITALFVLGGILGLILGQTLARRLTGPLLQRTFSVAILGVAAFVLVKNFSF